jgi:hypothetical protein
MVAPTAKNGTAKKGGVENQPYCFHPDLEKPIVYFACTDPGFMERTAHELRADLLHLPECRLAMESAQTIRRESGEAPTSAAQIIGHVSGRRDDGKVTHEEVTAVCGLFDLYDGKAVPDPAGVEQNLRKTLRKRLRHAIAQAAVAEFNNDEGWEQLDELRRREQALGGNKPDGARQLVTRKAADVRPQSVRWLWFQRIALGKLTLIEGWPGLGKTLVALDIAARVSRGAPMPLEPAGATPVPCTVLIVSYEDDAADTLRPRLEAAGADLARCHIVDGVRDPATGETVPPVLPLDLPELERSIMRTGAALVVVDPLMAALDGKVDSHRDQDVRRVLSQVRSIAERTGAAVVLVRHLRKTNATGQAITAGQGSIGIIGAARGAHVVGVDPSDDDPNPKKRRRVFAPIKNNVGADDVPSMAYRVVARHIGDGTIVAPIVDWCGESEATADDLTRPPALAEKDTAVSEAANWLKAELVAGARGSRSVRDLQVAAKKDGIAWRTIQRAKDQLGVVARKPSLDGGWCWSLPLEGAVGDFNDQVEPFNLEPTP